MYHFSFCQSKQGRILRRNILDLEKIRTEIYSDISDATFELYFLYRKMLLIPIQNKRDLGFDLHNFAEGQPDCFESESGWAVSRRTKPSVHGIRLISFLGYLKVPFSRGGEVLNNLL